MKKIFSVLVLFLGITTAGVAASRSQEDALQVARQFVQGRSLRAKVQTLQLVQSVSDAHRAKALNHASTLFIYNIGEDDGFVVISGDDRFKPVLGYSDSGHIADANEMPDGLCYWLDFLSSEMENAVFDTTSPDAPSYSSAKQYASEAPSYMQSVDPLLTTKWNQKAPYNNKIPNFATGCVATGLAQVMKYWQYPVHGIGSHTNGHFSQYSADFASTTYNWSDMKDEYGGKFDTKEQVDAVATLMYHLGVATDMQWTADNSGTPNLFGAYALINFFGYNKNLYAESRDHVSLGAWKSILLDQLYTNHPVCYAGFSGANSTTGHFFVLDGYDAETGKFHFNWGWGGTYDGYFELTALNPGGQGQAGAANGTYNYFQLIFVNVQPEETDEYVAHFDCDELYPRVTSCDKKDVTMCTMHLTNNALRFEGTIGLAVYNQDGSLCQYVASPKQFPNFAIGSSYTGEYDVSVDLSNVPDGSYTACVAACHTDYPNTPFAVRAKYGKSTYYALTVADGKAVFSELTGRAEVRDSSEPAVLNAKEANTLYQNLTATFRLTVKNTGTSTFNDEVGVCIKKGSRDSQRQYIMTPCLLLPGEEKTVTLVGKVLREPGEYSLINCCGENGDYYELDNKETVVVKDEASAITSTSVSTSARSIFTLQGVRMPAGSRLPKGIYVVDGKLKTVNN